MKMSNAFITAHCNFTTQISSASRCITASDCIAMYAASRCHHLAWLFPHWCLPLNSRHPHKYIYRTQWS